MNTNLILLVVKGMCSDHLKPENFDTVPQEVMYENSNNSLSCHKAFHSLPRCRPKTACIRTHPDVSNIQLLTTYHSLYTMYDTFSSKYFFIL